MAPNATNDTNCSLEEMGQVVNVLDKSYYGPYLAKRDVLAGETQDCWQECASEVSRMMGNTVSVQRVKEIWNECKRRSLLLKDLPKECTNDTMYAIRDKVLALIDAEELQLSFDEQLKKEIMRTEQVKVVLAQLQAKMKKTTEEKMRTEEVKVAVAQMLARTQKMMELLEPVKVDTGNDTVVIVSDDSSVDESASSTIDETNDASSEKSLNVSSETSMNASPESSKSD